MNPEYIEDYCWRGTVETERRRRVAQQIAQDLADAREDELLGYNVEQMDMFPDFNEIGEYTLLSDEEL